jgi:hypothetical protein
VTDIKLLRDVEIKSASQGIASAVFATFWQEDLDGDVTHDTAFTDGQAVLVSQFNHGSWQPGVAPAGKGRIRTTRTEAIADLKFFLGMRAGQETFDTVAQLAEDGLGSWSYGYDIVGPDGASFGEWKGRRVRFLKRLTVTEVSPVMRPAGIGTRTLAAMAEDDDAELAAREYVRFMESQLRDYRRDLAAIRDRVLS